MLVLEFRSLLNVQYYGGASATEKWRALIRFVNAVSGEYPVSIDRGATLLIIKKFFAHVF